MHLSTCVSYGLAIVSLREMEAYRKERKIRAKKMLTYFAKSIEVGKEVLQKGLVLPIGQINLGNYYIGFGVDSENFPNEYEKKCEWSEFNLCIGEDNAVWAVSLGELDNFSLSLYENNLYRRCENVFTFDPVTNTSIPADDYCGIKFEIPKGSYKVKIVGLKRKDSVKFTDGEYGFHFLLTPVEALCECADVTEIPFAEIFEL